MNEQPDLISLQANPINVDQTIAAVSDPKAGAIATFLGITRTETGSAGQALKSLDYQAYEQMAIAQMRQLAITARQRWPICRIALVHRVGRVEVGQPSVLIAVSTPHRADAFEACRFLIDSLKADTTIWKKEIWNDGTQSWVNAI